MCRSKKYMTKLSAAQIVVKAMEDGGVGFSLGIPGTHNIELYDALIDSKKIQTILVTDEQSASFMADGVFRASGKLACVNLVPSAGLTNAMSGIAEAFLDQIPMLVLSCGIRQDLPLHYQLHEVDQLAIASPVCKKVSSLKNHDEIYPKIREAIILALTPPYGPVLVEVPVNLYLFPPPNTFAPPPSSSLPFCAGGILNEEIIKEICERLSSSRFVGIYVGLGALGAHEELLQLADRLDAVVFTTISGKGVFPETHPRWGWVTMGCSAPPAIQEIEKEMDCLLAIGCRFGEVATGSYGFKQPEHLIHIDIDATVFNKNFKGEVCLEADAKMALQKILNSPALKARKTDPMRLQKLAKAHELIKKEQQSELNLEKVSPSRLLFSLQKCFGEEAVFVTDSGNGTFIAMEYLRLPKPRSFLGPVDYSCMGYSVPAAIGAKLATPSRPVVGLIGDGAFLMTGFELLTAVTYGVGVVALLLHDGELAQIAQFQRMSLVRAPRSEVHSYQAMDFAKAVGVEFLALDNDNEIEVVLNKAKTLSEEGKTVFVDVNIDYSHPTYFTKGVVKTNFLRFPWKDRLRLATRFLKRKIFPPPSE